MWDVLYVLITLVFFAAMLWYVSGCERLGGRSARNRSDETAPEAWRGGARDER